MEICEFSHCSTFSTFYFTESNCIRSYQSDHIYILLSNGSIQDIDRYEFNENANLARIILLSNLTLENISFAQEETVITTMPGLYIIYGDASSQEQYSMKFYEYNDPIERIIHRIFTNFCIEISGGPIFQNFSDPIIHAIVTIRSSGINKILKNNYDNFDFIMVGNYWNWINQGK